MSPTGEEGVFCFRDRLPDEAHRMDADRELLRRVPSPSPALAIEIDQRVESLKTAPNNRDHQGKAECAGADEGLRHASNAKPHREAVLTGPRENALACERQAEAPLPRKIGRLAELEEEVEFLGKESVIVLHLEAKQCIGFPERAPANDDFGATFRDQVEGRELLKHPHRVSGAQDLNCACEPDSFRARSGSRQDDCWRRIQEFGAMVFAHAEHVQSYAISDLDLFEKIGHAIGCRRQLARRRVREDCRETVDADFHNASLRSHRPMGHAAGLAGAE